MRSLLPALSWTLAFGWMVGACGGDSFSGSPGAAGAAGFAGTGGSAGAAGMGAGGKGGTSGSGADEAMMLVTPEVSADANPQNLTADEQFLYWTSWGVCVNSAGCDDGDGGLSPIRGRVQRVSKDGTDRQVLFDGEALPTGVAVDNVAVYWTTWWITVLLKLAK